MASLQRMCRRSRFGWELAVALLAVSTPDAMAQARPEAAASNTATVPAAKPAVSKALLAFVKVDAPVVAIRNVRVIDGLGNAPQPNRTLLLREGRIAALDDARLRIPADAKVIDAAGMSVFPGLVGMHNHMFYPAPKANAAAKEPLYPEHASSFPKLYLAGGVTTIRTTGSMEPHTDLELKKAIDAGRVPGPKMHTTGPYLEGKGSFALQLSELSGADDARATVDYWIGQGATSFKAYMHISRAELAAAIDAAHAKGIKVTGHLCSIGFNEAIELGIDNLEHGLLVDTEFAPGKQPDQCPGGDGAAKALAAMQVDGPEISALIDRLVAKNVAITSTLPVFETFVPGRAPMDPRVLEAMLPQAREEYRKTREAIAAQAGSNWPALFKLEMAFERAFVAKGGLLMTGLDPTGYGGVIAGYGDQRGLELLVEAGFSPVEAIRIATSNGAKFLGDERIGVIAPGKAADLVLVRGDPSTDIGAIKQVDTVFKDGIGFDPAKLEAAAKGTVGLR